MGRPDGVSALYGYGICLIAVLVFLFNAAGLVSNIFRVVHPLAVGGPPFLMMRGERAGFGRGPMGGRRMRIQVFGHSPGGPQTSPSTPTMPGAVAARITAAHTQAIADARFEAWRRLVVNLVLIALALLLFLWHWRWLHPIQPGGGAAPT
jgi:hypothetical protein